MEQIETVEDLVALAKRHHASIPGDNTKMICGMPKDEFRTLCKALGTSRKAVMESAFGASVVYPTKAFKFGCSAPLTNADVVDNQLRFMRLYRNAVTALNRQQIHELRELDKTFDQQMIELNQAIAELYRELRSEDEAIKQDRIQNRSKNRDDKIRIQSGRDIQRELDQLKVARKQRKRELLNEPQYIQKRDEIFATYTKRLKELSKMPGCKYTQSAMAKALKNAKHFSEWNGDGILCKQVQRGVDFHSVCKIRPITDREKIDLRGKIPAGSTHMVTLNIGNSRTAAEFAVNVHRPIPYGCEVTRVVISRRGGDIQRSAKGIAERRVRWELILTVVDRVGVFEEIKSQNSINARGACAVDVGWRRTANGRLKVITWAGDDGRHGTVELPEEIEAEIVISEQKQSERDDAFNEVKCNVAESLREDWESIPEECQKAFCPKSEDRPSLKSALSSLMMLRSTKRLKYALFAMEKNGVQNSTVKTLQDWYLLDGQHMSGKRMAQRVSRRRQGFYHRLKIALFADYEAVFVENLNVAELNKRSSVFEKSNAVARANIRTASVGQFLDAMRQYGAIEVEAANTSKQCSCCGKKTKLRSQEWYTCEHCGEAWNRDENACQNILSRGLVMRQLEKRKDWEIGDDKYRESKLSKMSSELVASEVF